LVTPKIHLAARDDFDIGQQGYRVGAMVNLKPPHYHVDPLCLEVPRLAQHRKGFADSRCSSDKDFEPSAERPGSIPASPMLM
jgi:hypothetical protein